MLFEIFLGFIAFFGLLVWEMLFEIFLGFIAFLDCLLTCSGQKQFLLKVHCPL